MKLNHLNSSNCWTSAGLNGGPAGPGPDAVCPGPEDPLSGYKRGGGEGGAGTAPPRHPTELSWCQETSALSDDVSLMTAAAPVRWQRTCCLLLLLVSPRLATRPNLRNKVTPGPLRLLTLHLYFIIGLNVNINKTMCVLSPDTTSTVLLMLCVLLNEQ